MQIKKHTFLKLLGEYGDVFVEKPGLCYEGMHQIHVTSDFKPQRLKAYGKLQSTRIIKTRV